MTGDLCPNGCGSDCLRAWGPCRLTPIARTASPRTRNAPCVNLVCPAIYDLDFIVESLRSDVPGYSLRFSDSLEFAFEFKFAPLMDSSDFIGPVYDSDIGATQLVFSIRF